MTTLLSPSVIDHTAHTKSTTVKHAQTRQTGVTQIIKYHPVSPVRLPRIKHDAAVREREPGIRALQVGVLETATPQGGWLGRGASVWLSRFFSKHACCHIVYSEK